MAPRYGSLVDIHGHFLAGERSWLTGVIEPSLEGASEVRVEWQFDTLSADAPVLGYPRWLTSS